MTDPAPTRSMSTGSKMPKALLPSILIFFALIIAMVILSTIWVDFAWYQSLGFTGVFTTRFLTGVALVVGFMLVSTIVVGGNLLIAYRMRDKNAIIAQSPFVAINIFRVLLLRKHKTMIAVISLAFGIFMSIGATSKIDLVLAWLNSSKFNITDPYFNKDISFYIFSYPWYDFLLSKLLLLVAVTIVGSFIVHVSLGGLRKASGKNSVFSLRGEGPFYAPVKRHFSVLIGVFLIVYALTQLLGRYGLAFDQDPLLVGITYTDHKTRMMANLIIAGIAFIVAVLFIANAWLGKWSLPALGVVLMVVSALILSVMYPLLIQQFNVRPDEPTKEAPYIKQHLAATKHAYGIEDVSIEQYTAKTDVTPGQLKADAEALPGVRLMDPGLIGATFEQMQQVRGYYSFPKELDVDRYTIDGEFTDAVVAIREMTLEGVDDSWNNVHTVYTHGYGMVAAHGNKRQGNGLPVWIQGDIPPQGRLAEHEGRVYYGEESKTYAIVGQPEGATPWELDTPGGGEGGTEQYNTYSGKGGVDIGSFWKKTAFAIQYGDINILLSNRVNSSSKIMYHRTPVERVSKVAPWLSVDRDPFPAVVDGRTVWVVDGYTTANTYPNSQRIDLDQIRSGYVSDRASSITGEQINYIRNSVKATVDAYDGTVTLYAWDDTDPILQTWRKVYPNLVKDKSEISADLMQHLRYGQEIFKVQREILGRYHTNSADTWYQKSDLWVIPDDPTPANAGKKESPYFLSIKWPGDEKPLFSNTSVYVPQGRDNLVAYLSVIAEASSPDYGKLRVLKLSDSRQIDGPGQTFNAMTTDDKVAAALLPFNSEGGARIQYGNLLTLPLGGGLMYVEPVYTMQQGSSGSYPVLRFVIVRFGTHVAIGDTLQDALDLVFKGDSGVKTGEEQPSGGASGKPATPAGSPTTQPTQPAELTGKELLGKANEEFVQADAALKQGDLAGYQSHIDAAKRYISEAAEKLG